MAKCLEVLKKTYADIPEETLADIVKNLDELKRNRLDAQGFMKLRKRTVEQLQLAAEFKARQIVSRKRADQFLQTPEFKDNPQDAFLAKFNGVDYLTKGGNDSFMQTKQSVRDRLINMLRTVKDQFPMLADGRFDEDLATAVEMLNKNQSIDGFPLHVREAAKVIRATNKSMIKTLQEFGVVIKEREDYIARQSHNREKITEAKFDTWSADIYHHLDAEKTFEGVTDTNKQMEILRGIYKDIESGEFENNVGNFGGKRVLHFLSGKDWAQYNAKYGHGTILDSIVTSINSGAKAAASARVLGPDGKRVWEHMEKKIASKMSPAEKAKWMDTSLGGQKRQRDNWLKEMYGYDLHPGREVVAKTARRLTLLQAAAKLGSSLASQFTDIAFSSLNFKASTGARGFVELDVVKSFLKSIPKEELNWWAGQMDMYFGDMIAETYDRWGGFQGGGMAGGFEKFARQMATLSQLERQSMTAKVGNARLFASYLAKFKDAGWGSMDPRLKAGLERFNIGEKEWGDISKGVQEYKEGMFAITPEGVREALGDNKHARELATRLANYLGDMARTGTLEATARERAVIAQGFSPDDPMGAFLRVAGQFKAFALAVPRVLRRIGLSNPDAVGGPLMVGGKQLTNGRQLLDAFRNFGDAKLLAATMTEVTLLSAAGIMVKDALKGKDREIDGSFLLEAFVSGALPLSVSYTMDALRGEYDSYGRSIFKDLAGPTFGQVDDVIKVLSGAARLDSKAGKKAVDLVMNNTPGINLPFAKVVLNKLFLTDLQEYLHPGYELRLRQRAMREGTEFLFNPF